MSKLKELAFYVGVSPVVIWNVPTFWKRGLIIYRARKAWREQAELERKGLPTAEIEAQLKILEEEWEHWHKVEAQDMERKWKPWLDMVRQLSGAPNDEAQDK